MTTKYVDGVYLFILSEHQVFEFEEWLVGDPSYSFANLVKKNVTKD